MAKELLFERETARGEVVIGRPLSPFVRRDLENRSKALYPEPDITPFVGEPDPDALTEEIGKELARQAAEDNPEYKRLKQVAAGERTLWLWEQTLLAGVIVDTPEGRAATLERYRDELEITRAALSDPITDDWLACVCYCLVTTYEDMGWIHKAAFQLISEGAQQAAVRYFRRDVKRH